MVALDTRWRTERELAQQTILPDGEVVVSCWAPYGNGGLGRHLEEIVDALDRGGRRVLCMCGEGGGSPRSGSPQLEVHIPKSPAVLRAIRRLSPARGNYRKNVAYDLAATRQLPPAEQVIAFNGQALEQLRSARRRSCKSLGLVSANPHMRRVVDQHAKAYSRYPLERSWATRLVERNIKEYAQVDRIYVGSRYTWESFVDFGISEEVLAWFPLTPNPRYVTGHTNASSSTFDIVYVGRLCVTKGVPLLVEAVRRLPHRDLRLLLVGGWSSRGMRRFLQTAQAEDPRIEIGPGDPLPRLQGARLCVHPAYEDGFAYAPAEALACGIPVLVSQDTGMKELVDPGRNGLILPTGDISALTQAIDATYRSEILSHCG